MDKQLGWRDRRGCRRGTVHCRGAGGRAVSVTLAHPFRIDANGATYCLAVEVGQITPVAYIDATFAGYYLAYGSPVRLSWDFTYEAA